MSKKLRNIILSSGLSLALVAGCMQTPKPGDFLGAKPGEVKKDVAVLPPSIFVLPIHGGGYKCEKITDNRRQGIRITKHHWLFGKGPYKEIYCPLGAENMGVKNDPLLNDRFYITYDLAEKRILEEHHIGFAADKKDSLKHKYLLRGNRKIKIK